MSDGERSIIHESRVWDALEAGIPEERIAKLLGVTLDQVRASAAKWKQIVADHDAWRATLAAEKTKLTTGEPK